MATWPHPEEAAARRYNQVSEQQIPVRRIMVVLDEREISSPRKSRDGFRDRREESVVVLD
jgi:hypothetical protein